MTKGINMIKHLVLSTVILFGCSSVKEISSSNQNIQDKAIQSKEKFEFIHEETRGPEVPDFIKIHEVSAQGILEQTYILKETKDIVQATTGVKDITPWWSEMIVYVMVCLSILGVIFGLWYLGVGHLTKALFMRIGFISAAKKDEAKLFLDALDTSNKTTIEEAIAALRARDTELDLAFKKEKKVRNARKQSNTTS